MLVGHYAWRRGHLQGRFRAVFNPAGNAFGSSCTQDAGEPADAELNSICKGVAALGIGQLADLIAEF
jgi:hypothetical protein